MILFRFILLQIYFLQIKSQNLTKFLQSAEFSLKPDLLIIIRNEEISKDIYENLRTPRLTINKTLNDVLKYKFSSNSLTIWFAKDIYFEISILKGILLYNNLSKIIVILQSTSKLFELFKLANSWKFPNLIATTKDASNVYTFNFTFQDFENFETENISEDFKIFQYKKLNINKKQILLLFENEIPSAYGIFIEGKNFSSEGYVLDLISGFAKYINGDFQPVPAITQGRKIDFTIFSDQSYWDFMSSFKIIRNNRHSESTLKAFQYSSDVLEMFSWKIIVPVPKPLDIALYFTKPVTAQASLALLGLLLCTSFLLFLSNKGDFWEYFLDLFRASLSICFDWNKKYKKIQIKAILCFIMLLGAIVTSQYSTILGSFTTTLLYEKPIKTVEDILKSGLKIAIAKEDFEILVTNISEKIFIKDMLRFDFILKGDLFDNSVGYAQYGDRWKYYFQPRMQFYDDYRFLETDIVLNTYYFQIILRNDSVFKDDFNRFIHKIKDTGLYNFWTGRAFFHCSKLLDIEDQRINRKPFSRTFPLRFFEYIFRIWNFGLIMGFIVFCCEVLRK